MFQLNFHPCITEPTRITNTNKPSLVDNIFINTFDDPVCGNILEHISYDHLPNFTIINHEHSNKKLSEKKRDKRNFDPTTFQNELLDGNFLLELLNVNNAESAYNTFLEKFNKVLDKHAPMRELSKKEKKIKEKPWITTGLLKSISKKRMLFKKFKQDKFKNKESSTYQQYKTYNDCINKLKKICKKDYYQKYFTDNCKNSKKVWSGINTLLNRHRKKQNTIYLEEEGFMSDPTKVANKFNDFFPKYCRET